MKKRTLMIATAVAALTVGTAFAQAPSENHSNPAARNAPAEKMSPNAGAGTHNSASEQKSTPSNRMGEAPGSKRETTGQAPSEHNNAGAKEPNERSRSTTGQGTTEKGQMENRGAREKGNKTNERNRSTTGQEKNQMENRGARENGNKANERSRSTTGQGTTEKGQMENRGSNENRSSTSTTTTGGTRGSVHLSSEQRTKIHTIIIGEHSAPRVGHVDFSVNVGTRVPRTIHLAAIPSEIVTIEPEWRGYEYFLVEDQIVVVDPATMEIVAVLPA